MRSGCQIACARVFFQVAVVVEMGTLLSHGLLMLSGHSAVNVTGLPSYLDMMGLLQLCYWAIGTGQSLTNAA